MNFLKEMTGFYMHSVCLPEKATKRFKDFVGKNLEFKGSSGDVWHVGLIRSGDKLVLEPGWNNFAGSNNVLQNDILLFQLVSGSTFEVRIFNSGVEKCDDFESEADDDEVQDGIMSSYSSKINGISAKPHSRKRSRSQNHNSLPLRKQLKKSNCGSHCQEKENIACKEAHKVPSEERGECLESEGKYEISLPVKNMNRQEEETIEEARNSGLLAIEHQVHLGRKSAPPENGTSETMTLTKINGTSAKPHSRKRSRSQNHNSLPLRKQLKKSDCGIHCQEKEKTACKEAHKVLSEEREECLESEGKYEISLTVKNMNRQEEETLEEARNSGLLAIEHQVHLGRKSAPPENGTSETMTLTKINGTSAKPHSRKRSRSQNHNSLPLRKQLKKSDCGIHCQEKEKTACKEAHKVLSEEREECLESEKKYEISLPVKNMNRQEEKTLEEARNSGLLAIEHQVHLGRKSALLENGPSETMTVTKKHSSQNQINCGMPLDCVICGTRCWQTMSDEQKARANCLVHEIQAGNPAFLHILKYTHLHKRPSITVPKEFSAAHLQEVSQTFILRRKENEGTWPVNYFFRQNREGSIEGKSLLKFIKENNLKKGDICIFELTIIANHITFVVHISQATFESGL